MKNTFFNTIELQNTAEMLIANGMKIYYHPTNSKPTFFHYTDGKNIGYCQEDRGRVSFSTVHKPCREAGTGYVIHNDICKPTIEQAKDAFVHHPQWASSNAIDKIKKYRDFKEYMELNTILDYSEYTPK